MKKPDLYLINGPLGAGKTTFLRHMLARFEFASARVIENEFASVSIDTDVLHAHMAEVKTIAGVCICCSSGDKLVEVLLSLAGSDKPVIIEATGVANSLQLVEKLVLGDVLSRYRLAHAVFVLDGAETNELQMSEYRDELIAADTVLVSKLDLVSKARQNATLQTLREIGVRRVLRVNDGIVKLDFLHNESTMLHFFAGYDADLRSHDTATNYTVLTMEAPLAPAQLKTAWPRLQADYSLLRMKGDIVDTVGACWHVEATPAQVKVVPGKSSSPRLVLIGSAAKDVTPQKFWEVVNE